MRNFIRMCKGVFRWKLSEPNIYLINTSNVIGVDLYAVGVTRHFGFFPGYHLL